MSYEKVKIEEIRKVDGKNNKSHFFLRVRVTLTQEVYMNDTAQGLMGVFKQLVGKECLLPATWSERQGRPNLNLEGDCVPLELPADSLAVASAAMSGAGLKQGEKVDLETGEIKDGKSDDDKRKGGLAGFVKAV